MDWHQATRNILDSLDLAAEAKALGLDIVGEPNGAGWAACRVLGQEDRNPSAGFNVKTGKYKAFTGNGESCNFFEFAALAGKFADWREARSHYAQQAGVKLPRGPRPKGLADSIKLDGWHEALGYSWARHKPPIQPWAVQAAGGQLAGWPLPSKHFTCMALPAYGPQLTGGDPCGWTIYNITGRPLDIRGKDGRTMPRKTFSIKGSVGGWMNAWALDRLDQAEVVWKVEGPTDMLALQSEIPEELREKHLVIANSQGTVEHLKPELV